MNRFGAGLFRCGENLFGLKITLRCGRGTDQHRVISLAHVQRGAIGLGINRDRFDAEFAACANDADRNLSAVGN